jgi:pimeloyl-ACP methyl ester carboxylesterase
VLIAGLGGKGTSWRPFLRSAARRHSVLTFDNRGSGSAPPAARGVTIRDFAHDLLDLLDALGVASARLVGRSMGGMIAQEAALLAPERVERLVLVSTTGQCDPHLAEVFLLWAAMAQSGVPLTLRHQSAMLWCLGREAMEKEAIVSAYLESKQRGDRPEDYARQALACAEHDALDRLRGLRVPTLVVAGDDDRLTPLAHARALVQAIPGAALETVPGAGHLPYLESPERFEAAVLGFLGADRGSIFGAKENSACRSAWTRS